MFRLAVIDLGTNSVRFDIHEVASETSMSCLYRMKKMVRLGEGVFKTGKLNPKAVQRTIEALKEFKKIAEDFEVDEFVATGTSALREVKDSRTFIKRVESELGFRIRIISGVEEARLIMKGIFAFEPLAGNTFGFIDIGGGSTEVGFCKNSEIIFLHSLDIGSSRIHQMFSQIPPLSNEIERAKDYIRKKLGEAAGFKDWPKLDKILGSSGSIKALIRIMKETGIGKFVEKKALKDLIKEMERSSVKSLLKIPGMEERRVDLILGGALILESVMDFFDAKEVYRTKFALREGILQERLEQKSLTSIHYQLKSN